MRLAFGVALSVDIVGRWLHFACGFGRSGFRKKMGLSVGGNVMGNWSESTIRVAILLVGVLVLGLCLVILFLLLRLDALQGTPFGQISGVRDFIRTFSR